MTGGTDRPTNILTGISGWHRLEDFYPPRTRQPDMLSYYAEHFSLVEVATTFQGIPTEERVREWADSVPDGFLFDVLAFGGLTLHQRRPGTTASTAIQSWSEIAVEPPDMIFDEFASAIAPLSAAGKLGVVMLQFPPWFVSGRESIEYLTRCRERLSGLPLAVEFRSASWFLPASRLEDTLDHLIDLEIALSLSDFPPDRDTPPFHPAVTLTEVAPVRLHGRKKGSWEKIAPTATAIAEFSYGEAELGELAGPVAELAAEADRVHVIFNVQPASAAVRAATDFREMVGGGTADGRPFPAVRGHDPVQPDRRMGTDGIG